jgi:peptidyl-prolyl cis-trans isomerase C
MKKIIKKISQSKKLILLSITLTIGVGLILATSLGKKNDPVAAKINGVKIYKSEVEKKLRTMIPQDSEANLEKLPKEILEILVKDIYVSREIDKKVAASKITKRKEVKEKIDEYSKKIARQEYLDSIVKEKITPEAVKNKYVELVNELNGKREIHLKYILAKTEDDAKKAHKELKAGKSFAEIAKKYSIDENSAKNGGDLNYVLEDNLGKEFFDIISPMKKGQISAPIKTTYGWNIFKVEDFRNAEAGPFESIKAALEEQMKKEEIKKVFVDISENSKVEILIKSEAEQIKAEPSEQKSEEKPAEQK